MKGTTFIISLTPLVSADVNRVLGYEIMETFGRNGPHNRMM